MLARRRLLQLAAATTASAFSSRAADANAYPARPVRVIVTVPAGGSPDIIGRLIAQWLSDKLGQPFVVENKPGASTNIGTELVLKSAPDGNTLLLAMSSNAINPALYHHLNFDFLRDAVPVASIATIPLVMDVNPAVPAKTVPEFIAYAKANPGKVNLASGGSGTPLYVAGALFRMMAGLNLLDVIYQGEAAAMPDLVGGRVQAMFGVMPASLGYIKSGKLRALAVTSAKRQELLPEVPAMAEFLPGYEANGWYGLVAPNGTPPDVVATLNKQVNAALADPATRKRFTDLGCDVFTGTPSDFAKFIAAETEKWAKVVKFANIKAD
ncbi:MAG TPA: tripartite tricarboxylate transporter substrate binding protein [Xanthobacteraceae bacterium]|jgi:tripartite-type tricarboxylate transporter receptor subunit TctC|nr:tripartite tricarboxylate transporter substrate binding protein [Xanthobacteraceae bacterium]